MTLLVALAIHGTALGWWALLIGAGAVSSIYFSVLAIKKNDPAWLLLDFILPN
ncbi:hypothetical protein D3C73_102620 [compost metagenome]